MPVAAWSTSAPLYDLAPEEPEAWPYADVAARRSALGARRRMRPRRRCWRCSARPSVASKRWAFEQYDSVVGIAHRPPAGGSRRGRAAPARGRRDDRDLDRRQRAPRRLRPVRAARSRRCSSARRTSPASAPSRSGSPTASTSATRRSRRSPGSSTARRRASRTPATRSASRWWAATSRSTTRPTGARSTRRRWSAWSASCPIPSAAGGLGARRRATRSRSCGPFAPSLAGSELAKLRGELGAGLPALPIDAVAARDRSGPRRGPGGRRARAPTTSATAGSRARSRRSRSPAASASRLDLDPLVEARGCSGETALFGEGPGGFVVAGDRARLEALAGDGVDVFVIGEAGGDRIALGGRRRSRRDARRRRARLALARRADRERRPRVRIALHRETHADRGREIGRARC